MLPTPSGCGCPRHGATTARDSRRVRSDCANGSAAAGGRTPRDARRRQLLVTTGGSGVCCLASRTAQPLSHRSKQQPLFSYLFRSIDAVNTTTANWVGPGRYHSYRTWTADSITSTFRVGGRQRIDRQYSHRSCLTNLEELWFSDNRLTGTIPTCWVSNIVESTNLDRNNFV